MLREIVISTLKNEPVLGLRTHCMKQDNKKRIINESFKIKSFVVILLKSGTFKIKLQDAAYNLLPQEVLIISQNETSSQIIISGKVHLFIMALSTEFLSKNDFQAFCLLNSFGTVRSRWYGKEWEAIIQLFKLVCILNKSKLPGHKTELQHIMELLLTKLTSVYTKHLSDNRATTPRRENLVLQFHLLLKEHCRTRHNVGFYADKLCITAGYLNKIVKELTGQTAKILIEQMIVLEIKKQLQNKGLTLLEIAEQLGFNDLSSFSTFFKTHTSVAPSEYRSQMLNHF